MQAYRVFTKRMAEFLTLRGFQYIRTVQDIHNPNFINWIFEDSEELRQTVNEYHKLQRGD